MNKKIVILAACALLVFGLVFAGCKQDIPPAYHDAIGAPGDVKVTKYVGSNYTAMATDTSTTATTYNVNYYVVSFTGVGEGTNYYVVWKSDEKDEYFTITSGTTNLLAYGWDSANKNITSQKNNTKNTWYAVFSVDTGYASESPTLGSKSQRDPTSFALMTFPKGRLGVEAVGYLSEDKNNSVGWADDSQNPSF